MPKVHYAGELTVCQACAEPIIFLISERTGTLAPITIAKYPNGNIQELSGHRYRALGPDDANKVRTYESLRLNHFSNCPDRARFKR